MIGLIDLFRKGKHRLPTKKIKLNKVITKTTPKTVATKTTAVVGRNALTRGTLRYQDILDQPKGKFFLIIEPSPMQSLLFAVDRVNVDANVVRAWIGDVVVTEFAIGIPWFAIKANYVETVTSESMLRNTNLDTKLIDKLRDELMPAHGGGNGVNYPTGPQPGSGGTSVNILPTGQYL